MELLHLSVAAFLASMFIHVFFWRVFRWRSNLFLLVIFASCPIFLPLFTEVSVLELLMIFTFNFLAGLAYVVTTPAFESSSPTSTLLLKAYESGDIGCDKSELFDSINDEDFVLHRLRELAQGGYIENKGNRFFINEAGKKYLNRFTFYSRFVGQETVGG